MIYCIKYCVFLFIFLLLSIVSCNTDNEKDKRNTFDSTFNTHKQLDKNTYNNTGLYIAGRKSKKFSEIQQKDYYRNYVEKINQSWNNTTAKNLIEIEKWSRKNMIPGVNDRIALFYPFSGPDFLYADAFFPKAHTYILVGLENPGKLPTISKMNDQERTNYLNKLLHSFRYVNQSGYFSTKQMMNDFTDSSMNGILHILLFYISKTEHTIMGISSVGIDDFGNYIVKKNFQVEDKNPNGIRIKFFKNSDDEIKTLYYFPIDLSDENMKDNLGFLLFLSGFSQKNTFMKSASYILHDNNFQLIRNLILNQSKNILQDDSGIPYSVLKKSGYQVNLFGSYSRTIKTFSTNFQADLQHALEKEGIGELSFKLGYNSWQNEMVLLLAKKKENKVNQLISNSVTYKVQIKTSWKKIPEDSAIFKSLPPVDYYFRDGFYKYTIGSFASEKECETLLQIAINKGFVGAFVLAFYKKNRISLEKAKQLTINK